MAPRRPRPEDLRTWQDHLGKREGVGPLWAAESPHPAPPALGNARSRAFPPAPSARGPALQARARHEDPGERRDPAGSRRLAPRLRSTGAEAGGPSCQGGARSPARTGPRPFPLGPLPSRRWAELPAD